MILRRFPFTGLTPFPTIWSQIPAMALRILSGAMWIFSVITTSYASSLDPVGNSELIDLLAHVEVINGYEEAGIFVIRIFRTIDPGECDPNREAETCPHSRLWILSGSNNIGEGIVNPKLWRTERRIGWEVGEIRHLGVDNHGFDRTIISVTVCETDPDVESGKLNPRIGGWWKVVPYDIDVTKNDAIITRGTPSPNPPSCPWLR
jgi:hypothetical protein